MFLCMVSRSAWYRLAATMMASSGLSHTNPWHSSCFATPALRITAANSAGCGDSERASSASPPDSG